MGRRPNVGLVCRVRLLAAGAGMDRPSVTTYTVQHVTCGACGHPVTAVSEAALFAGLVEHQAVCKRG